MSILQIRQKVHTELIQPIAARRDFAVFHSIPEFYLVSVATFPCLHTSSDAFYISQQ